MAKREKEVEEILYGHPLMADLRALRDGELSIASDDARAALMEYLMAMEGAITRIAARVDRLGK